MCGGIKLNDTYLFYRPVLCNHPTIKMPVDVAYHMSPLYIWSLYILYHWFYANFNIYDLLNAVFSLDPRILLISINIIGLYLFLRFARIDFTMRVVMNTRGGGGGGQVAQGGNIEEGQVQRIAE
jgi:hypothetical protein